MKIKSIKIKGFKRFEDLEVKDIPQTVKLVVLVGPNGSGKTSLFEAFNCIYNEMRGSAQFDKDYHTRVGSNPTDNWNTLKQRIQIETYDANLANERNQDIGRKRFYFRTAYRHEADFTVSSISKMSNALNDSKHPSYLFHGETRVSDNYQRIVAETVAEVYRVGDDQKSKKEIREKILGKASAAVANVFSDLRLNGPGDPMQNGTFLFSKGSTNDFRYKNLSGGEKAAFDLILDFIVKSDVYNDTVFCIDEPELHMHSRLQGQLLNEVFTKLPGESQLWISTHSIGMLHKAKELSDKVPGSVAFLDFHGCDFDRPMVITPSTPTREFWRKMFGVAIDELSDLLAPKKIVFCEGKIGSGKDNRPFGFDPRAYRKIFEVSRADVEFSSLGGDKSVSSIANIIGTSLKYVLPGVEFLTVLDGDDRSAEEVKELGKDRTRVLSVRDLESYLWSDEILNKLCVNQGKTEKIDEILKVKNELIAKLETARKPKDDIKAICGELYNTVKSALALTKRGNDAKEFAIAVLAPLITQDTTTYKSLDKDIFG